MGSPTILQILLIVNANIHLGGSAVRDQLRNRNLHMSPDTSWKQRQHIARVSSIPSSLGFTTPITNHDEQFHEHSEELRTDTSSNYADVGSKSYFPFRDSANRQSPETTGTSGTEHNAGLADDLESMATPSKRISDQSWLVNMKKFHRAKPVTASMDSSGRLRRDRSVRSVRDGTTSPTSLTEFDMETPSRPPSPVEQVSTEKDSVEPAQYAPQTGRDYTNGVPAGPGEVFRLEIPPLAADGDITRNGLRDVDRPKSPINGDRSAGDVYSGGSSDRLVPTSAADDDNALNFSTSGATEDGAGYAKGKTVPSTLTTSVSNTVEDRRYTAHQNDKAESDEILGRNAPPVSRENSLSHAALQRQEAYFTNPFEFDNFRHTTVASSAEGLDTHGTTSVATTPSTTNSNLVYVQPNADNSANRPSSSPNLQRFNNRHISLFSLIAESASTTSQKPDRTAAEMEARSVDAERYEATTSTMSDTATNYGSFTNGYQHNSHIYNMVYEEVREVPRDETRPGSAGDKHLINIHEFLWNAGMQNDGPAMPITAATDQQQNRAIKDPSSIPMKTKEPLLHNIEHYTESSRLRLTSHGESNTKATPIVGAMLKKEVKRPVDNWSITSVPSITEALSASVPPVETATLLPGENGEEHRSTYMADLSAASTETESEFDIRPTEANLEDGSNDTLIGTGGNSSAANSSAGATGNDSVSGWPVKLSAVVEGELVLGGLMMVHERSDTVTCGPVMPQGGVQALETMLYTLDRINAPPSLLPNVTIGAHILDDCDKDTYGLEMAVDFIKGSISNIDGAEYHCNKTAVRKVISGVVGAASSVTSIQVANLLRLFKIPQVSFFSTSPELSNKQRFEFFSRTIPSDHYQVKAMVEIVRRMGWSYISIIYEESNYGIKAFEELETLLARHNICIAVKEKLVKDSGVAEEAGYDSIVNKLLTKPRARGAIIFGSDQEVAGVMRAVRRCNATGSFSWIGSDGWSARSLVSDGNELEVEGTLSVQPQANPVRGFHDYFLSLTVENNRRNPWFVEFWEDHFHCKYPNSSLTPYNSKYTTPCTTKEVLTRNNTAFEDQLQFVSDAVMAFGYAFRDMHRELCHGRPGLCDAMKPIKGTELLKYLRKVDFVGLSGDKFRFDPNGDGPARYNIIHFKQLRPGHFKWVRVGEYQEGELRLNMSEIQFKLGHPQPPESVCSLPCESGQAKKYVEGESCCWHCFNCTQYQIRHPTDETQCLLCPLGTTPDEARARCRDIPEVFLRASSGWAIGAMSLSATGVLVTLFVAGVFARHNDTPVVRASGRELSYVLLTGILLCYSVTFALVLRPTDAVCGVQRFGAGFCFTVVYAALLTKTNRIARIFHAGKRSARRPSFISPRSQLCICSALVGVQVLINGVWILVSPPRAVHHYPTREDNHLVCSSHIDASYMIAFGYPIVLIVVCTVYAVLTRKIPEAFNESKHIGFTMYTTCVIWLAFVPLYFGTSSHVPLRITSMSVTISLSASVTLACLFSPKLYIIIVHPERNVRQSMMPVRYSAKSPAVTGTTQTGSMMAAVVCGQKPPMHPTGISSQTTDSGMELELREDIVHQRRPVVHGCVLLLVNRSTQTEPPAAEPQTQQKQEQVAQQQQQPQVQLQNQAAAAEHGSSNGPVAVGQAQQQVDVQL